MVMLRPASTADQFGSAEAQFLGTLDDESLDGQDGLLSFTHLFVLLCCHFSWPHPAFAVPPCRGLAGWIGPLVRFLMLVDLCLALRLPARGLSHLLRPWKPMECSSRADLAHILVAGEFPSEATL